MVAEEVGFADGDVTGQAPPFGTLIRQSCQPCDIRLRRRELRTSAGPKQSPLQVGLTGFRKGEPQAQGDEISESTPHLLRDLHSSTSLSSMASVSRRSSSIERSASRSWMNSRPSASATIPVT